MTYQQCVGIISKEKDVFIRCSLSCADNVEKKDNEIDGKDVSESTKENENDNYLGLFCQHHYCITRPFYNSYKKITDSAILLYTNSKPSESTEQSVILKCYAKLSLAIQKRQNFTQNFIHPDCQDVGHRNYLLKLITLRQECETVLKSLISKNMQLQRSTKNPLVSPQIEEIEECKQAEYKQEEDIQINVKSKNKRLRKKLKLYLNKSIIKAQNEAAQYELKIQNIFDQFLTIIKEVQKNIILPKIHQFEFPWFDSSLGTLVISDEYLDEVSMRFCMKPFFLFQTCIDCAFSSKMSKEELGQLSIEFRCLLIDLYAASRNITVQLANRTSKKQELNNLLDVAEKKRIEQKKQIKSKLTSFPGAVVSNSKQRAPKHDNERDKNEFNEDKDDEDEFNDDENDKNSDYDEEVENDPLTKFVILSFNLFKDVNLTPQEILRLKDIFNNQQAIEKLCVSSFDFFCTKGSALKTFQVNNHKYRDEISSFFATSPGIDPTHVYWFVNSSAKVILRLISEFKCITSFFSSFHQPRLPFNVPEEKMKDLCEQMRAQADCD